MTRHNVMRRAATRRLHIAATDTGLICISNAKPEY
jgi:hypothetical protein